MQGPRNYHLSVLLLVALTFFGGLSVASADRAHPFRASEQLKFTRQSILIASGDFDHDGRGDLAVTFVGDSTVHVYSGRADGKLATEHTFPFHGGLGITSSLLAADIDGDGFLDLVITEGTSSAHAVHFLRNNGANGFEADLMRAADVLDRGLPTASAADVDGDSRADLAMPGATPGQVLFLRSLGASGFAAPVVLAHDFAVRFVTLADVDGDGSADLTVVGQDTVAVRFSLGAGAFSSPTRFLVSNVKAVADANGDHRADLWRFGDVNGDVWLGLGNGSFTVPATLASGATGNFPRVVDLDGDGTPEALLAYGNGPQTGVYVYRLGTGGKLDIDAIWNSGATSLSTATDFDGDGIVDLAMLSRDGDLRLARGRGARLFEDAAVCRTGHPLRLAIRDLDGDALGDLLAVSSPFPSGLWVFHGYVAGIPRLTQFAATTSSAYGLALTTPDAGSPIDAVVSSSDGLGRSSLLPGVSGGTFGAYSLLAGPNALSGRWPIVGDFDGDGLTDIAQESGAPLYLAWGHSGGGYDPFVSTGIGVGRLVATRASTATQSEIVSVADSIRILHADGHLFRVTSRTALVNAANGDVAARDLNGDGVPDLVFTNPTGIEVHLGSVGGFGAGVTYPCGDAQRIPFALALADVDGDGKQDVVVTNKGTPTRASMTVWYGTGSGTFTDRADVDPMGYNAGYCALGDLDGDSRVELAVGNDDADGSTGNDVLVFFNSSTSPVLDVPAPSTPKSFAIDRLWPDPVSGGGALSVSFSLPVASRISMELIDLQGRRVLARSIPLAGPGTHMEQLEPRGLPAGLYFLRVSGAFGTAARRVAIVR